VDLGIQGRVALVGGASQGIGRAVAEVLVAEGARVVITSRNPDRIVRVAEEIGAVAGLNPDPLSFTTEQWEQAHRTLVLSPMRLLELVLPGMRERGWGRVVAIASTTVREPIGALILSNAERSAQLAAYKTVAREVARDGVTINSLLTGSIATERLASLAGSLENAEAGAAKTIPAGRLGRPEEMAWAAAFLASHRAAYITGAALAVDGGALRAI
jgi:3-oxoacyl-[acyl-carrier protein] reductase